jgi:hypothetical protein
MKGVSTFLITLTMLFKNNDYVYFIYSLLLIQVMVTFGNISKRFFYPGYVYTGLFNAISPLAMCSSHNYVQRLCLFTVTKTETFQKMATSGFSMKNRFSKL